MVPRALLGCFPNCFKDHKHIHRNFEAVQTKDGPKKPHIEPSNETHPNSWVLNKELQYDKLGNPRTRTGQLQL